ncbi:MAG TPA: hypothetical protein VK783_13405 [Bacteroidia bacterium]|jgi:hypothetical protein|nr:hypothetical protein [Bacteroidia bacterium]
MEIYTTGSHDFLYQTQRRKLKPSEIALVEDLYCEEHEHHPKHLKDDSFEYCCPDQSVQIHELYEKQNKMFTEK